MCRFHCMERSRSYQSTRGLNFGAFLQRYSAMLNSYVAGEPLRIGNDVQLFIDDTMIEDRWRLTRVMHHPDKYPRNPLILPDKEWEADSAQGPKVIWDDEYGKFRMWYTCFNNSTYFHGSGPLEYMAYAESDDGFNWT